MIVKNDCVEIYWDDLSEETQNELEEVLGENENYDVIPIAIIMLDGDTE